MDKKNFIRIVNEEIKNFDFLNNEESAKEQENIELLQNEDLQKQFICDSLLNRNEKIKIINMTDARMSGDWDSLNNDDRDALSIEYNISIDYVFDSSKEPLKLDLSFNGSNVEMNVSGTNDNGDYLTPSSNDTWINSINWQQITVSLFTSEEEKIDFIAYDKAPEKIQNLFIREFLEEFITEHTEMDVREKTDNTTITQYC